MRLCTRKSIIAILAVALVGLAGCQQTRRGGEREAIGGRTPHGRFGETGARQAEAPTMGTERAPTEEPTTPPRPRASGMATGGMGSTGSVAVPTGDPSTSTLLLEKSAPSEVIAGAPFEYEIRVTNLTSTTVSDVVVTDVMSGSQDFQGSTPPVTSQDGGGRMSWALGDLAGGESRTIRVTTVARGVGIVTSCADVTYNRQICVSTEVVEPSLALQKDAPSQVLRCDPIVYHFRVSNTGSGAARNVRVTDNLPAGLVTTSGQNRIDLDVGTLAAGETRDFDVSVQATTTGDFQNSATATAEGGLSSSDSATTRVVEPRLEMSVDCAEDSFEGRRVRYEITVRNTGDAPARDTVVTKSGCASAEFVSATEGGNYANGTLTWLLGTLQPGDSRTLEATMTPRTQGELACNISAKAYCADAVSDTCRTQIRGIPAILLEVIDLEDPIEVGRQDVTYLITATNQGSAEDTNIAITCEIEEGLEIVSTSGATNGSVSGRNITFTPLPVLAAKARAEWRVVVRAQRPGLTRFRVAMDSTNLGGAVAEETEPTNFYE